ncbi:MAG: hypothetical protein KDB84_11345 [Flavobacteriales bacterium]|nr:hypothetical protein [Flavobacteriales bacterium]
MTKTSPKGPRADLAIASLSHDDPAVVLEALDRIEESGDARAILPLLRALTRFAPDATSTVDLARLTTRITTLLHTVKAPGAAAELLHAMDLPEFTPVRNTIVAAFWNAGLDVQDHLDRFVAVAITGESSTTFECLTVIENQEFWPVDAGAAGAMRIEQALSSETDEYKRAMLEDIARELKERADVR